LTESVVIPEPKALAMVPTGEIVGGASVLAEAGESAGRVNTTTITATAAVIAVTDTRITSQLSLVGERLRIIF
jgi:hypothetical protein